MGSNLKALLNNKAILVLLFVVSINMVISVMVWRLDLFVHSELYQYGLVFSFEWADPYWSAATILWSFLFGTVALAAGTIAAHYLFNREGSSLSRRVGFVFPVIALTLQGISLFFFDEKNWIVWNMLKYHGLQYEAGWVTTYNSMSAPVFALIGIALFALIIPAAIAATLSLGTGQTQSKLKRAC